MKKLIRKIVYTFSIWLRGPLVRDASPQKIPISAKMRPTINVLSPIYSKCKASDGLTYAMRAFASNIPVNAFTERKFDNISL